MRTHGPGRAIASTARAGGACVLRTEPEAAAQPRAARARAVCAHTLSALSHMYIYIYVCMYVCMYTYARRLGAA